MNVLLDSLSNYVILGLDPGSFGTCLLLGDKKKAIQAAHPLIKKLVEPLLIFTNNNIPLICRGNIQNINDWISHNGLKNISDEKLVIYKIQKPSNWIDKKQQEVNNV
jgi:hypothetical protein